MPAQVLNVAVDNNADVIQDLNGFNDADHANEHVNDDKESSWRRRRLTRLPSGEWQRTGRLTRVQYKE